MKRIGIYCSAADNIDKRYFEEAREIGRWMAANNIGLTYGGADCGTMFHIADSVREAGGHVLGIMPDRLCDIGKKLEGLDEFINCRDLSERKDLLIKHSDIILALPGGIGTLDEVFTTMSEAMLKYHNKKMILYSSNGYWDNLTAFLRKMEKEGFVHGRLSDIMLTASSINELEEIIKNS